MPLLTPRAAQPLLALLLTAPLLAQTPAPDFGAVADGQADAAPVLQAAIDRASAAGGGTVALPAGRFRLGQALVIKDRVILRGAGMGVTVIEHGDGIRGVTGGGAKASEAYAFAGFEDLTFRGGWDRHPHLGGNEDRHIAVGHIAHVWFHRVEGLYGTQMAFTTSYCDKVEVLHCRVLLNARDGFNLTGSRRTQVLFNEIRHNWDDAIAIHTNQYSGTPPPGEHQVAYNVIEDSFGIKLLGATRADISHNTVTRPKGYGLWVGGHQAQYGEGNNDVLDLRITDNTITDPLNPPVFGSTQQVSFGIYVAAPTPSVVTGGPPVPPGQFDGQRWVLPEGYWHQSSRQGAPFSGGWRILVADNLIAKTLPDVERYSAWGYRSPLNPTGRGFHCNGWTDLPVQRHLRSGTAIALHGGASQSVTVRGNLIEGWRDGVVFHSARRLWHVEVTGNRFHRLGRTGVMAGKYPTEPAPEARPMLFQIVGNTFDLDPYLEHANRNPDGTWKADGAHQPNALDASLLCGVSLARNSFRNLLAPVHGARDETFLQVAANRYHGEFTGPGDRADNRGVRVLLRGEGDTVLFEGSDPTRADYGRALGGAPPVAVAERVPTQGCYLAGTFVRATTPQVHDGRVLLGWLRQTTGQEHAAGRDWLAVWGTAGP